MKRILILIFIVIFVLSGCKIGNKQINDETSNQLVPSDENFILCKMSGESLHPITSQNNTNRDLLRLSYDSLFKLNEDFEVTSQIAKGYTLNDNTATVEINEGFRFWDGTSVTAEDVEYSYAIANGANSTYKSNFRWITGFSVVGNKFVVTFSANGQRQLNLLDIPIIKKNSDIDNIIPVGSGRYTLKFENGKYFFVENINYPKPAKFIIKKILVEEAVDKATKLNMFNAGTIKLTAADIFDSNNNFTKAVNYRDAVTNTLTFLGVNNTKPNLQNSKVRNAISVAINRKEIVNDVLLQRAVASWYPFFPKWKGLNGLNIPDDIYSVEQARLQLRDAGAIGMSFTILVSADNPIKTEVARSISIALSSINITTKIEAVPQAQFNDRLNAGDFDLYIGEVVIPDNMDLSIFNDYTVNKGRHNSYNLQKIINDMNNGANMVDVVYAFANEQPFIPLYYKNLNLAVAQNLSEELKPQKNDIFTGIENSFSIKKK